MTIKGKLIIIGSGIAGINAARAARRAYPHIGITLIGSDPNGFYNRIAVGALAVGKRSEAELFPIMPRLFADERITTRFGDTATAIDTTKKTVQLSDGKSLSYDRLILATGASPWTPPISGIDNRGVQYLWTMDDAQRLKKQFADSQTVAIIGGGILGVEAALDMAATGKKVHLIEAANALMAHHLPTSISGMLKQTLAEIGISAYTRALVSDIQKNNAELSVRTSSVTISCDVVIMSAGVRANTKLAKTAGLKVDNGIVVDSHMKTSDSHVLACGNCVAQPQGGALLWNPAKRQGEIAGENAFEVRRSIARTPYPIHLKSNRIALFSMGDPGAVSKETTCLLQQTANGEKRIYVSADGTICHAVFWGDVSGHHTVEKLFQNKMVIPDELIAAASPQRLLSELGAAGDDAGYLKPGWVCSVCGYIHEDDTAPGVCPVCNVGRDQFLAA